MKKLEKLFGGASLNFEQFAAAIGEAGLSVMEGGADAYVPASREAELLSELENTRQAHRSDIARIRAEGAVREALVKTGAHNPAFALRAMDLSDLDGNAEDIYSAAEAKAAMLRMSDPYLFRSEAVPVSTGAPHGQSFTDTDSMSDADYYRHIRL